MSTRWIVADEMVRIVAEARLGLATHCLGAAGKIEIHLACVLPGIGRDVSAAPDAPA